jgi:hypothetical protein
LPTPSTSMTPMARSSRLRGTHSALSNRPRGAAS